MSRAPSGATSTDAAQARQRAAMVEEQLRERGIRDRCVLGAMGEVPRHLFVPEELRDEAYADRALAIGEGQTISQPWIVAAMTSLLGLRGGERVLEVGTGSGYGAAVLSRCSREVVSVERVAPLAQRARELLASLGYGNVEVVVGDGSRGAPEHAPFDAISVTATAQDEPPAALLEQLAPGGVLVGPVARGGEERLMRFWDGDEEEICPVRFVPLVAGDGEGPGGEAG